MAIIFPYEPDWSTAVEMEREYKTEITTSRDLTEQRKAHRQNPRRTVSFDVRSNRARGEDIMEYLEANAQQPFWVPDPTRSALLGDAVLVGGDKLVLKGVASESIGSIGDRAIYFILDRSASLTPTQFNTIKATVLDSLSYIETAIQNGNRVDLGVRFWSDGTNDVALEQTNLQMADVDEFRDFINATGQLTGGNVVPAYTAAEAWFLATKDIKFAGRSVILVTDSNSNDGFSAAASGPAADMLDRNSGVFSIDNGNSVNCNAINYNQPTTTYTSLLDNTGGDGVPVITDGDTTGLADAIRRAAISWTNVPFWLKPGVALVVGRGTDALKELVTISAVSGDTVTLDVPVSYEWPQNTVVRMAMLGRFEQEMSGRWLTLTTGTFSFVFMEDPNSTYDEVYRSQRDSLWYDGREVWLRKPNWREPVDAGVQGYLATLKTDKGVFSHSSRQPFNTRMWSATYTGMDSFSAEELIQFVHRKRGQRHSFWMPTWRADMVLSGETLAGANTLTVNGTDTFDRHNGSEFMNRVAVFFTDGSVEFNTVASMAKVLGDTQITMANDWSRDLTYSGVYRICWMPLWRLAADKLNMVWPTSKTGETKIAIQQLRADHVDDGYFPITEFTENGNVSTATRTYNMTAFPFLSTGSILGSAGFDWAIDAKKISDGTDAEITLTVTIRFFTNAAGSVGSQIGADIVRTITASGLVQLSTVEDIPSRAGFARFILARTATLPGDTSYVYAANTVNFRGKP